jgi:hypothetical protein
MGGHHLSIYRVEICGEHGLGLIRFGDEIRNSLLEPLEPTSLRLTCDSLSPPIWWPLRGQVTELRLHPNSKRLLREPMIPRHSPFKVQI